MVFSRSGYAWEARIDVGRPEETWVGRDGRGEAGIDVGRPGWTWGGRDRRGEAGRDVGRPG